MNTKTRYNPDKHHRRTIRLCGYDYSCDGLYFITVCSQGRACLFGEIVDGEMILNPCGTNGGKMLVGNTEPLSQCDFTRICRNAESFPRNFTNRHRRGNPCGCPRRNGCPRRYRATTRVAPTAENRWTNGRCV